MTYQELIESVLQQLQLTAADVAIIRIDYPGQTVTVITHATQKHVVPFPAAEQPKPKRVKAVKEVN